MDIAAVKRRLTLSEEIPVHIGEAVVSVKSFTGTYPPQFKLGPFVSYMIEEVHTPTQQNVSPPVKVTFSNQIIQSQQDL